MRLFQRSWSWTWNPKPKTHFAIVLIITLLTSILSIVAFLYAYRQITESPIVEGIVVNGIMEDDHMRAPVIEYSSLSEGRKRFKSRFSSSRQLYFVGDRVDVILVGPDHEPKLKNFMTVYGLSAFLLLFAVISAIGSTAVYHFRLKK